MEVSGWRESASRVDFERYSLDQRIGVGNCFGGWWDSKVPKVSTMVWLGLTVGIALHPCTVNAVCTA